MGEQDVADQRGAFARRGGPAGSVRRAPFLFLRGEGPARARLGVRELCLGTFLSALFAADRGGSSMCEGLLLSVETLSYRACI